MPIGFRSPVSRIIGGMRALPGQICLMLFVTVGIALMGVIYVFGRLIGLARRSAKVPFSRPELPYSGPRQASIRSAE